MNRSIGLRRMQLARSECSHQVQFGAAGEAVSVLTLGSVDAGDGKRAVQKSCVERTDMGLDR